MISTVLIRNLSSLFTLSGWVDFFLVRHPSRRASLSQDESSQYIRHCIPSLPLDGLAGRLNLLLNSSGPDFRLNLCPYTDYPIDSPLYFSAPNQEITTYGYPTGPARAKIIVSGLNINDGTGHSVAVDGLCSNCSGCRLTHVQIDGGRRGNPFVMPGANIQMGGVNPHQLIEHVKSYDPRGWSCLHAVEGDWKNCSSMIIRNNDIGPGGFDYDSLWADGISVSCSKTVVTGNEIVGATDGGIVVFAPEVLVENNTLRASGMGALGGINLVDHEPWGGNYTGVVVQNNHIHGGYATGDKIIGDGRGTNLNGVWTKIGIAMGPRIWFGGETYAGNVTYGAIVRNNTFSGGFGFAMAANGIENFTVLENMLVGNTTFFGTRGPNCTDTPEAPIIPQAFVNVNENCVKSVLQSEFTPVDFAEHLICLKPPPNGDFWPFSEARATTNVLHEVDYSSHSADNDWYDIDRHFAFIFGIGILYGVLLFPCTRRTVLRRFRGALRRHNQRRIRLY